MFDIGKPKHSINENLRKFSKRLVQWRNKIFRRPTGSRGKFLKWAEIILIALFLAFITLCSFLLFTLQKVYKEAGSGRKLLENSLTNINQENFEQALEQASQAHIHFDSASESAKRMEIFPLKSLRDQIKGMSDLLQASGKISEAFVEASQMGKELDGLLNNNKTIKLSKFSPEEKEKILDFLYKSGSKFERLKADLNEAAISLDAIRYTGVFSFYKESIEGLKAKITKGKDLLGKSIPMLKILPSFLGYPEKSNFLVLLQNSDELRPTGGFLGTFSILSLENGEITDTITHDIYHLDMPVKDALNIDPPEPLKKYLKADRWFLRDANWSPDWPTAARKIEWFYYNEDRLIKNEKDKIGFEGNFSGIVAITPEFINDLLAISGPITVEGQSYNKGNFTELLEYRVERGYEQRGIPSWHRKEVISEIYEQLKIKLFDLELAKWQEIIDLIDLNLKERNIMIYMKDPEMEKLVRAEDFTGEVKETANDYFMVVDANMASAKTDSVMEKSISYKVEEKGGDFMAKLKITYRHNGKFDWRTTRYRTYTRVYVPLGSRLIKVTGLSEDKIKVYKELNKTCMAGFISIDPGKEGSLEFEYRLPQRFLDRIKNEKQYELYIQRQPGNNIRELTADFSFEKGITNYNPSDCPECRNEKNPGKELKWITDLKQDRKIEISF